MNISANSAAYAGGQVQRLLGLLLPQGRAATRQDSPGGTNGAQDAAAAPPPPGPPPGVGLRSFAARTLGSLLSAQEQHPSASDIAGRLITAADGDGDGALSLTEIQTALGATPSDRLAAAFNSVDADSDGKVSAEELTAGLQAARGHHGHHARPASSDVAASLISNVDTDADGALSLAEIAAKLGVTDPSANTSLASHFASLDKDGDGKLSATEIAAAIDALANYGRAAASTQADAAASVSTTA